MEGNKLLNFLEKLCSYHMKKLIIFVRKIEKSRLIYLIYFNCFMGGYRSAPETSKFTNHRRLINTQYCLKEMCGWRTFQQDAFITEDRLPKNEDLSLFAIFDGHAGSNIAKYASRHFVEVFLDHKDFRSRQFQRILCQTFMKLDEMMQSQQRKKQLLQIYNEQLAKGNTSKNVDPENAGTTALVCLITSLYVYIANAGDSRAICSVNGEVKQLSKDHKPEDQDQKKRITNAGGWVQKGRVNGDLSTSRGLGDFSFKRNVYEKRENQIISAYPDIKKLRKKDIDFIFLGCDGVWQQKSCEQMKEYLRVGLKQKMMDKVLEDLFEELICKDEKGGPEGKDNMTAILIQIIDS